jgi:hypothetical protein
VVYIIIIDPTFIPCIVGRVYVYTFYPASILGEQGFEGQEIIAFYNEVAGGGVLGLIIKLFDRLQGVIGDGKMVVPDGGFALEL